MNINPLTQPSEVSGKIETRSGGASGFEFPAQKQEAPRESHKSQTERLNELKSELAKNDITLSYSRDDETNQLVIRLVDDKTGEAIRQIPSEVSLKLAAQFQGSFIDEVV
ncbi:MAG: flagellar protein FlaG [Pyrinomonadaceae bacterium]